MFCVEFIVKKSYPWKAFAARDAARPKMRLVRPQQPELSRYKIKHPWPPIPGGLGFSAADFYGRSSS